MKSIGKTIWLILSFLVLALAACRSSGPEEHVKKMDGPVAAVKKPLKIGVVTWVGTGPLFVAKNRGFFGPLEVDIQIIDDTAARRAALTSGAIQLMAATVDDFANARAAGLPAKAVLKTDDSFGGDGIVAAGEIETIADLKGKTVAYPRGLPSHFFLLEVLRNEGLSSGDIVTKDLEAGQAGAAFVAGKVDAAVTWEPWLSKASEREGGHLLISSKETPGLISDILVANETALANRRQDIRAVVKGWFKALDYCRTHQEEAYAIMADALSLPIADFQAMVEGIQYSDLDDNRAYFGQGEERSYLEVFSAAGKIWLEEGMIESTGDAAESLDRSILAEIEN